MHSFVARRFAIFIGLFCLIFGFQNCSPYSPQDVDEFSIGPALEVGPNLSSQATKSPGVIITHAAPSVLVNHDLFVHTDRPIETGGLRNLSYVTGMAQTAPAGIAVDSISLNQAELAGLGAGFSLSATYGSHNLWFWNPAFGSYRQWLDGLLGNQAPTYFNNGPIDTLILNKVLGQSDLLADVLQRKTASKPIFMSVRMNDHHHLVDADKFNADVSLPVQDPAFSRRVAALTPEYLKFLSEKKVISGEANPSIGKTGQGLGCDKKDSNGKVSYHLDFSDPNVILQKIREIEDLFASYDDLDGVELDFIRSNCFFTVGASTTLKNARMKLLFDRVFAAKEAFEIRTKKSLLLTIRIPIDEAVYAVHGINLAGLAQDDRLDGIIFGYSKPYLRSQVPASPVTGHAGLKTYFELYQITDNQSRRRPATIDEIATSAYEALYAGYHGISLFNFHYLFKDNAFVKTEYAGKAFSWKNVMSYLNDRERIKTNILPSYFFGERNAEGDFLTRGIGDSVSVGFRFARNGRRVENSAVLRILLDDFKSQDKAAWDSVIFNVKVNGVVVKTASGADLAASATTSFGRDPIRYFSDSETQDWGPAGSKVMQIPKSMFRDYTNRIEVVPVKDLKGFFNTSRRLSLQLTM